MGNQNETAQKSTSSAPNRTNTTTTNTTRVRPLSTLRDEARNSRMQQNQSYPGPQNYPLVLNPPSMNNRYQQPYPAMEYQQSYPGMEYQPQPNLPDQLRPSGVPMGRPPPTMGYQPPNTVTYPNYTPPPYTTLHPPPSASTEPLPSSHLPSIPPPMSTEPLPSSYLPSLPPPMNTNPYPQYNFVSQRSPQPLYYVPGAPPYQPTQPRDGYSYPPFYPSSSLPLQSNNDVPHFSISSTSSSTDSSFQSSSEIEGEKFKARLKEKEGDEEEKEFLMIQRGKEPAALPTAALPTATMPRPLIPKAIPKMQAPLGNPTTPTQVMQTQQSGHTGVRRRARVTSLYTAPANPPPSISPTPHLLPRNRMTIYGTSNVSQAADQQTALDTMGASQDLQEALQGDGDLDEESFEKLVRLTQVMSVEESTEDMYLTVTYTLSCAEGLGTECPICLDDYVESSSLAMLPNCLHTFHFECINSWTAKKQYDCPVCRTSLR